MAIENQPIAPVSLNEEKPRTDEEQAFIELEKAVMLDKKKKALLFLKMVVLLWELKKLLP